MSVPKSDLYIITVAKKLVDYVFEVEEKSPKKFRGSLITKMDSTCLDLIELLYQSNALNLHDANRVQRQKECLVKLRIISFLSEIGQKYGCYTFHQYETISKQLHDCNAYLLNWMKSDEKRRGDKEGVE